MEYSQKLTRNPAFKVEKFDTEILLYAVSTTRGIYLNETAYVIWQLCEQENTLGGIITFLEESYPETEESIAADVLAVVGALVETEALVAGDA